MFLGGKLMQEFFINNFDISKLNLIYIITGIIVSTLVALASWNTIKVKKIWYYLLLGIYMISFIITILTNNWFIFIIGWEMVSVTTTLILLWSNHKIARQYFIIQFLGSSFLLYTILLATQQGYYHIVPINEVWLQNMFIIGMGMKSAIIGLHFWVPLIYKNAMPLFAAISSGWVVKLGFITYLKIITNGNRFLLYLGIIMVFYGGIRAFIASDYKLLLGYSTISQLGYIAIGIGSGNNYAYIGAIIHIIAHAFAKTSLFIGGNYWLKEYNSNLIHKFCSAIGRQLLNSIVSIISFISLAGFPFLAGYNSKYLIKHAFTGDFIFSLLIHLSGIITYLYVIRFIWLGLLRNNKNILKLKFKELCINSKEKKYSLKIVDSISLIIPVILLIILGIFPNILTGYIDKSPYDYHIFNGLMINFLYLFIAARLLFVKLFNKKYIIEK